MFDNIKKNILFIFEKVLDILIPEKKDIEALLKLNPSDLYNILPKSKVRVNNLYVLFDYNNKIVKKIIKYIKYKNHPKIKSIMSLYLYDELISIIEDVFLFHGSLPLIIPIPMSKKEFMNRGFNPCIELIKGIKKYEDQNIKTEYDLLIKTRETARQTKLNREERLINVKNSMSVNKNIDIKNKTIIILDDVYTTLATFKEAERVLISAGAKKVIGLFIAHSN